MRLGLEDSTQRVYKGLINQCYRTSSTPSIHLGGSFLVTPIAASGSKLIPDTRAIRSSASFKTQKTQSVITQKETYNCAHIKQLFHQYLIKLLLRLADSRVAPSDKKKQRERKPQFEAQKNSSLYHIVKNL